MASTNRRNFLKNTLGLSAAAVATSAFGVNPLNAFVSCSSPSQNNASDTGSVLQFSQEELPYEYTSLEPYIDAKTMEIHYSKHHKAYIDTVNKELEEENVTYGSEEELLANISQYSDKIRNNAGGAWNHSFFWKSLKAPAADNAPTGDLLTAINKDFGSLDTFKAQFKEAATGQFGSGWAWLINVDGTLKIDGTPNQDNPLMDDAEVKGKPVLGIDVWEHAYYLQYQNKRADYIDNFWNIVNWDFVASQL